jgi:hypothetical protein
MLIKRFVVKQQTRHYKICIFAYHSCVLIAIFCSQTSTSFFPEMHKVITTARCCTKDFNCSASTVIGVTFVGEGGGWSPLFLKNVLNTQLAK